MTGEERIGGGRRKIVSDGRENRADTGLQLTGKAGELHAAAVAQFHLSHQCIKWPRTQVRNGVGIASAFHDLKFVP